MDVLDDIENEKISSVKEKVLNLTSQFSYILLTKSCSLGVHDALSLLWTRCD